MWFCAWNVCKGNKLGYSDNVYHCTPCIVRKCWHFLGKLTNTQTAKNYKCHIETLATSLKLSYKGTAYGTDSLIDTCLWW